MRGGYRENSGRPTGSKNKRTEQWEQLGEAIVNNQVDRFLEELEKLSGKEYVDAYLKTLSFFKPRMKAIDHISDTDNEIIVTYERTGNF